MPGLLFQIEEDIKQLDELNAKIEETKQKLASININVDIKIANGLMKQLDDLLNKVKEIESRMANTVGNMANNSGNQPPTQPTSPKPPEQNTYWQKQLQYYKEVREEMKKLWQSSDDYATQLARINQATSQINADMKNYLATTSQEKQDIEIIKAQTEALQVLRNERKQVVALMQTQISTSRNELGSYDEMQAKLKEVIKQFQALKAAERDSAKGQELKRQALALNDALKAMDAEMGNFQRHVGNYERSFNGLNAAMGQVLREMPSLIQSPQMFFLAISNNLPILFDNIKAVHAETGKIGKTLGAIIKSMWSIGGLLSVIPALLMIIVNNWDSIVGFIKKAFGATEDNVKSLKEQKELMDGINKDAASNYTKEKIELDKLYNTATDVNKSYKDRLDAVKKLKKEFPSYFSNLSNEAIMTGKAASQYKLLTQNLLAYAKAKAYENAYAKEMEKQIAFSIQHEGTEVWMNSEEGKKIIQAYDKVDKVRKRAATGAVLEMKRTGEILQEMGVGTEEDLKKLLSYRAAVKGSGMLQVQSNLRKITRIYNREIAAAGDVVQDLGGTTDQSTDQPTGDTGKTAEERYAATTKAQQEYMEKYLEFLSKIQGEISDTELELMDEGLKKSLAQIRANKQKELDALTNEWRELAEAKAELDKETWLNAAPNREEADYVPFKSIEQYMAEIYTTDKEFAKKHDDRYNQILAVFDKQEDKLLQSTLEKYSDYYYQRKKKEEDFNKDIADLMQIRNDAYARGDTAQVAQADAAIAEANKRKTKELLALDFGEFKNSDLYIKAFEDLGNVSTETLELLRDKLETFKTTAATSLNPEDVKTYADALKQVEKEMRGRGDSWEAFTAAQKEYNSAVEYATIIQDLYNRVKAGEQIIKSVEIDANDKLTVSYWKLTDLTEELRTANDALAKSWKELSEATQIVLKDINDILGAVGKLGKTIGDLGKSFEGTFGDVSNIIGDALSSIESVGKGAITAFADIKAQFSKGNKDASLIGQISSIVGGLGAVGAAASAAFSIIKSIFALGDKKHEEKIEDLQDAVDAAKESYEDLQDAIEKAYSHDKSDLIEKSNAELERQIQLIEQQKREEEAKKNTDEDRIDDWTKEQKELRKQIEENKAAMIDAIFGEDLQSAIENFADALTSAWADGNSAAMASKDFVKQMLKQMVVESIKSSLAASQAIEKIREKAMQLWEDGIWSDSDQAIIQGMADATMEQIQKQYGWAESLFADSSSQSGSSKGFEAMSQDTADELNGRFTAGIDLLTRLLQEATTQRIAVEDIRYAMLGTSSSLANSSSVIGGAVGGSTSTDVMEMIALMKTLNHSINSLEAVNVEGWLDIQSIRDMQNKLSSIYSSILSETEQMRKTINNRL